MDRVKRNLKSPCKHGRQVYCKERNKLINMTTELQRMWEEKYAPFQHFVLVAKNRTFQPSLKVQSMLVACLYRTKYKNKGILVCAFLDRGTW